MAEKDIGQVMCMRKKHQRVLAAVVAGWCLLSPGVGVAAASSEDLAAMQQEVDCLRQRLASLEKQMEQVKRTKGQEKKTDKKHTDALHWSGSTKVGYMYDDQKAGKFKAEIRLNALAKVDDKYEVGLGLKFKSTSAEPVAGKYPAEKNKIKLDQAYVGRSFGNLDVKAGVQNVAIGTGLWLSKASVNQVTANYTIGAHDRLYAGYGRDSQDYLVNDVNKQEPPTRSRLLKFLQYQHEFSPENYVGVYYGTQQPERYMGFYGRVSQPGKWGFMAEYVCNFNRDKFAKENGYGYDYFGARQQTRGMVIGINYGTAKKKGTYGLALEYLNVDQNLFMDDSYTAWDDCVSEDGFKGVGLILDYATSDHTKLSLQRYWGDNKPSQDNRKGGTGRSLNKLGRGFTYLKFTTKF